MKKRDVLFLCQYFYPEYNSSATLPFDTASYLASHGKTVSAMCGYPKEYTKKKNIPIREIKDEVHIRRLRYLQLSRGGKIGRLINYFSFTISALLHLPEFRKFQCVIVYSNPPVLPIVPVLANVFFKTQFIFVAYDIYPEVAYASCSVEPGRIIDKIMRLINHLLYSRAYKVVALTEEMRQFILQNRSEIDEPQVRVIPNWAHENRRNLTDEMFQHFGYQNDQFIVSYFGNLGVCQDIETMISAIHILRDDTRIQFLIVAHGSKRQEFEEETKGCSNVTILDFLTGENFECALAISSCCIVSLENGLMGTCAPSKYYSYLQSGCPILAVVEENSYLSQEISEEGIGFDFRIGDGQGLAETIRELLNNEEQRNAMGDKARSLYENKYAQHIAMRAYDELVSQALCSRK